MYVPVIIARMPKLDMITNERCERVKRIELAVDGCDINLASENQITAPTIKMIRPLGIASLARYIENCDINLEAYSLRTCVIFQLTEIGREC